MRVIQPRTVAEQLLYSTVRISGDNGTGTGFFFHIQLDQDKQIQLILTNSRKPGSDLAFCLYTQELQKL
ncbi:TPA: hypothetical protein ACT9MX_000277 [Legionella pneumophila]|nr:hypothetical protein [Legionella pneumophila]